MKRMTKFIALLLALMMLVPTLAMTLTSCGGGGNGGNTGDNGGNTGNNSGNTGNSGGNTGNNGGSTGDSTTAKFKVNISSAGGMKLAEVPVYVFSYKDGEIGDGMIDFGMTDENGVASITLPKNASYAVMIEAPDGYATASHYPLTGESTDIKLESSVIDDDIPNSKLFKSGDIMYDFTVTDIYGNEITLSEVLEEKKVVILNFWYVDCSACQLEFPYMKEMYETGDYSDDVAIIALNPIDDKLSIRSFAQENGFTFDVAIDDQRIYDAFGVNAYPTSVVIDRYGMVSLIEVGALPSLRAFRVLFDHFISDDYVQQKISSLEEITPRPLPNAQMPSSEEISSAFDGGNLDGVTYYGDDEDQYSWPFIIEEMDGNVYIKNSNSLVEESYAQLFVKVYLEAGEALAFDYLASTERGADILYILVDKKDIYSISGIGDDWSTCYAYVAEEAGYYELAFCYIKDGDTDEGDDEVLLKNLRKVSVEDIDAPSYIYRFAATNPDEYNQYQTFPELFLNTNDGYYHVGSVDGPILLADLMNTTRFSEDNSVYYMVLEKSYEAAVIEYCSYASNSQLYGLCPVNEVLMELLKTVAKDNGAFYDEQWLEFCCYYDAYGTDEQLSDPIAGLATFSAYETILSTDDVNSGVFPNSVTYDRVIMPRGLLFAFTPEVSGTYKISTVSEFETNGWIFRASDISARTEWLAYDNVYRPTEVNPQDVNCYMIAYLTAGVTYYIDVAFYDVYQTGTINFRVDRLGDEGYFRFSLASPGYFTYHESTSGAINKIIAGGIDVELGNDGYYREKRTDGNVGSLLYADFTELTTVFSKVIYSADPAVVDMIDARAFDFRYSENDLYVLNTLEKYDGDVDACRAALREELGDTYNATYVDELGNLTVGFAVEEVLAGTYHGAAGDLSDEIRAIIAERLIKVGTVIGDETVAEGDVRIGCIVVDARLAEILQLLMDKYTFEGVENSWVKLCYYSQYFCEATPK